ncbi:hypothetical protein HID58_024614, partial [Brassica napus]
MCGVVGCGLAPGSAAEVLRLRDGVAPPGCRQFAALALGGIRLGMAILGSCWFIELEVVGARAQWPTRVRSSVRFKEWSYMPLQWPLAMPPHCEPQIRSSCFDILSWFLSKVGSCYVLSKLEAYRFLSVTDSFGRVVFLVSLTATSSVRPSLTSQHLTGLFELHAV